MNYFGLHIADFVVIVVYLVGIATVGLWVARSVKDTHSYFMGSRAFGKLLMIGQAFGVGTHAEQPVAVAGAAFRYGLSGIWYQWKFIFCTPFYWLIAPIFRRLRYITSAEYMETRYGQGMGILYTLYAIVFFIISMCGMLIGAGKVVGFATGGQTSPEFVIYSMTAIFVIYSFFGGLVIVVLSVQSFISIFAQPHQMATIGTGKTENNCRVGFTYGNFIKRICTLGWAVTGLIVAAMVLQGHTDKPGDNESAFGLACKELLGPGFMGLMIACILAANMSTCSAFMVDMGALFVQNIYRPYLRPSEADKHYLLVGFAIAWGVVGVLIGMAWLVGNI